MSTDLAPPPAAKSKFRKSKAGAKADPAAERAARIREAAMLLKQVGDATRLQVLLILDDSPRNVGQLCADLNNSSQPAVSHHLALLRHSRLIEPRRNGKQNIYNCTEGGLRLVRAVRTLVDGE